MNYTFHLDDTYSRQCWIQIGEIDREIFASVQDLFDIGVKKGWLEADKIVNGDDSEPKNFDDIQEEIDNLDESDLLKLWGWIIEEQGIIQEEQDIQRPKLSFLDVLDYQLSALQQAS